MGRKWRDKVSVWVERREGGREGSASVAFVRASRAKRRRRGARAVDAATDRHTRGQRLGRARLAEKKTHRSRRSCRASRIRTSPCRSARRRCLLLRGRGEGGGREGDGEVSKRGTKKNHPVDWSPRRALPRQNPGATRGAPERRATLTVEGGAAVTPAAKLRVRGAAERGEREQHGKEQLHVCDQLFSSSRDA